MAKINLNNITNLENPTKAVSVINDNNDLVEQAFENTLSRNGQTPNQMNSVLDMNSNKIINLPVPKTDTEPVRKKDIDAYILNGNGVSTVEVGTVTTLPAGSSAYVNNVGGAYNQILNYGIPKGFDAPQYGGTSTTSLAIGTLGGNLFRTQAGLAYLDGARVRASSKASPTSYMEGVITYGTDGSGPFLYMNVDKYNGSGTYADWNFNIIGQPGTPVLFKDLGDVTVFGQSIASGPYLTSQIATSTIPVSITGFKTYGFSSLNKEAEVDWVVVSTPSPVQPWHRQSLDGRWWQMKADTFTPQMFGAVADCTGRGVGTSDHVAINNSYKAAVALKGTVYAPSGNYRCSGQIILDVAAVTVTSFLGAGEGETTFTFDTTVTSPQFQIASLTGPISGGQRACFYGKFAGFTIEGYCSSGTTLRIGDGDPVVGPTTVYFNGTWFGPITVANRAPTIDSYGTVTTGLTTCWVYLTSNCGGVPASHGGNSADFYGTAHLLNHCSMTAFYGAFGNAKVGTHVTGNGSTYGCTWYNVDWEVLQTCFKCDNINAGGNGSLKITGGTMTLADYAFDVTAAQCIVSEGHAIGDIRLEMIKNVASDTQGTYGGYGLVLKRTNQNIIGQVRSGTYWDGNLVTPPGPGTSSPVAPTMPSRGTWFKNRWGQAATVYIYSDLNNALEIYKRDWFDFSSGGRRVGIGPLNMMSFRLEPGQSIMFPASASVVNWFWEPAE